MSDKEIKIVVTGDISTNNLIINISHESREGYNWQTHNNIQSIHRPGESLLLARMISLSTNQKVISPARIPDKSRDEYLRSYSELHLFPTSQANKEKVYRVGRFLGFNPTKTRKPELLFVENDDAGADIVVLDDENNGFNIDDQYWPLAIKSENSNPIVVYKMNNPIGTNLLWQRLYNNYIDKTIVVINVDDLRSKGVNISKSLSWEKTALDFAWQLNNNPNLSFLADCRHLVITFGLEGAIYYKNIVKAESNLYFLPFEFEGDFIKEGLGTMYGLTSCFVAALTASLYEGFKTGLTSEMISDGIKRGIIAARKYFEVGFGRDIENFVFPDPSIFRNNNIDKALMELVQDVKIPNITDADSQNRWYILQEQNTAGIADIAYDIVKNGEEKALKYISTASFGDLKVVDRTEIESYRSIKNLISEYISVANVSRPLSMAVFGTPGSGKSYGVTEIASSIAPGKIRKLTFNLSQMNTPGELIKAFHKISDSSLLGKIPFVVFDEFDSNYEGLDLGWLKYFLAPMQDGVYRSEESIHPIGKAIFVFAGGTSSSFKEFCGENIEDEEEIQEFSKLFKNAKGPDFVSRLRGYVNILGPNKTSDYDQLYIIRRAMHLRSLINRKLPHMINDNNEMQIDNGVLRAMLKIPRFKHETRSIEAIIDMSMLTSAKKWEQSLLPPKEQLSLHVDEEQFMRYMMHDAIFGEKVEELASDLRQKYNDKSNSIPLVEDEPSIFWINLDEEIKDFYITQVQNIPNALLKIQCDVIFVDDLPEKMIFSKEEIEDLSYFEYKRRTSQDTEIISWEMADSDLKKQIHQMVGLWSEILADSYFKVERLKNKD